MVQSFSDAKSFENDRQNFVGSYCAGYHTQMLGCSSQILSSKNDILLWHTGIYSRQIFVQMLQAFVQMVPMPAAATSRFRFIRNPATENKNDFISSFLDALR